MFNAKEYVEQRTITNQDALKFICSNDTIAIGFGASAPHDFLIALEELKGKVSNVGIFSSIILKPYPVFVDESFTGTFKVDSVFYGPTSKIAAKQNRAEYKPTHLRNAWRVLKPYRIYINTFSMPDEHGYITYGMGATTDMEMAENSQYVIAVINPNFPRIFGDPVIHVSEVDYFINADYKPSVLGEVKLTEEDRQIGRNVADLVEDGSTIQLGIGAIPNASALALMHKKDLGVHTEMLTDTIVDLYEAGVITGAKKSLHPGKIVTSFTMGSQKLYDFIDNNPTILHYKARYTNDPYVVGQNTKMVSINTTLMVDFQGQCSSESVGPMQISGTGGQFDTAAGAQICLEGKSIIAFRSTAMRQDKSGKMIEESKIVPYLPLGTAVTLSRNETQYVVTEYGSTCLVGKSVQERTLALINLAHPKFREQLKEEARKIGYLK